jgi:S-adenosylmethionine decarboxylase proenzyme
MKKILCFFLICLCLSRVNAQDAQEEYEFSGRHFIASYNECDHDALVDLKELKKAFLYAVDQCGATLLDSAEYIFEPDGMTMVVLLSESHASIHTYPEHNACFIDLFTCGTKCQAEKFDIALRSYLHPKHVAMKILSRSELNTDSE